MKQKKRYQNSFKIKQLIKKSFGFTLIELVVTVSIMIILIGWGIPGMQSLVRSNQLAGASNEVLSMIYLARSESIQLRRRVVICKSNDTQSVTPSCSTTSGVWQGALVFVDGDADGVRDNGERILRVWQPDGALTVNASAAISQSSQRIVFRPDGLARTDNGLLLNGSIAICIAEQRPVVNIRQLAISSGGRTSLNKLSGDGECPQPSNQ